MARSFRNMYTPIISATMAPSDKGGKIRGNRSLRREVKRKLQNGAEDFPLLEEVSDPWDWPKDGKVHHRARWSQKKIRKDRRGYRMYRSDDDAAMLRK